jgi:hypothetical protein
MSSWVRCTKYDICLPSVATGLDVSVCSPEESGNIPSLSLLIFCEAGSLEVTFLEMPLFQDASPEVLNSEMTCALVVLASVGRSLDEYSY